MVMQTWQEQIKSHLDLATQVAKRMPSGEYLETTKLNEILDAMDELRSMFILQLELQGFKTEMIKKKGK